MKSADQGHQSFWVIWVGSFAAWTFVALSMALSMYQFDRIFQRHTAFLAETTLPLVNCLIYATLTPLVMWFGFRYPLQRTNWRLRGLLYVLGGLIFAGVHVWARILVYPVTDPATKQASPIGWKLFEKVFLYDVVDDFFSSYLVIVVIAHILWYYRRLRYRELQASQLETQLAQVQLQALKSQLQPHFLFNTLHSISALMLTNVKAADAMMSRLSDLLRMSLENDAVQETTLNREMEFVNGYLEIEKVRFEDRLEVAYDVDPKVLDARVPHLLLQPLVENAIRHGISKRIACGEIRISATQEGHELLVQVKDNGPGIDSTKEKPVLEGVGIRATRERLRTLYGRNHVFAVHDLSTGGFEVEIRIPFCVEPRPLVYELEP